MSSLPNFPTLPPDNATVLEKSLILLRRRLLREAMDAIDMLERALSAAWSLNQDAAREIRKLDDSVDLEEVAIEEECLRLLSLHHPFAQDFRLVAFCMKANADIERVADHATSIAKIVNQLEGVPAPEWPTPLVEMGERIPGMCHGLLRAVLDEDVDAAKRVIADDKVIDRLDKLLFEDVEGWLKRDPDDSKMALLTYRMGRELERVGDLMGDIAEDVVYLVTGEIIRHQKKRNAKARKAARTHHQNDAAEPGV